MQTSPPFTVPLALTYMSKVYQDSHSYANLLAVVSALKWLHSFLPQLYENPFDSPICKNFLEAAKRCKAPIKRKVPITPDMIKAIIDKYAGPSASLQDLRLACLCSTAFTGFFRYNEICSIQPAHLEFSSEYLKIFVPRAKNDVYREGNYVYIKRLGSKYCAVSLLQRYISMAKIDSSDNDLPLFRRLRYYKSTNSHKLCREKLSYSRCREILQDCLKTLGYNHKDYGLHSLRSGGATAAVQNNHHLSERSLKLHGRWKSDSAKDVYILEEVSQRLEITNNLGLS